jgi:hypothetical protein
MVQLKYYNLPIDMVQRTLSRAIRYNDGYRRHLVAYNHAVEMCEYGIGWQEDRKTIASIEAIAKQLNPILKRIA